MDYPRPSCEHHKFFRSYALKRLWLKRRTLHVIQCIAAIALDFFPTQKFFPSTHKRSISLSGLTSFIKL
ncbi:hypothetical protein DEO72_LG1g2525 [Vigna unguiculata]|uniref:Uncharacterized protein n=1 Tax=Vigna unguiculata TaxID=3917 RepID=A0A4D6KUG9_VIGUN|nr:hypothetical protein DEO72_LG1g2525 [Vigna unguiculata]